MPGQDKTTQMLLDLSSGDPSAADRLLPHVYDELHAMAGRIFRRQPSDHTMQPTALVHEAYLRLIDQQQARDWSNKAHFMAVAARAMRQILVDHARARQAAKRGGAWGRVTLDGAAVTNDQPGKTLDVLALDEALTALARVDERQANVVQLRFFGGLSVQETGQALGVSDRTVELDWRMAKAWLSRALSDAERT